MFFPDGSYYFRWGMYYTRCVKLITTYVYCFCILSIVSQTLICLILIVEKYFTPLWFDPQIPLVHLLHSTTNLKRQSL